MNAVSHQTGENVIPLTIPKATRTPPRARQRFSILEFKNRSGSKSWRVTGIQRDGTRVRENSANLEAAQCRQLELEAEYLQGHATPAVQATSLTTDQVRLSESAIVQLGDDWQLLVDAVIYWKEHGKQRAVKESPRIDDAVDKYLEWLKDSTFRDATKRHWKTRMTVFKNSVSNIRVADFTPELIEQFLAKRNTSPVGKDTDKRAVSRFFSWCIERPRRWTKSNPCKEVKIQMGEKQPPKVLSVKQCKALLKASEPAGLAPYMSACMFGGLRPFESRRLTWDAVNLKDLEIRLEANQAKTGKPRVIAICETLAAWLKAHKGKEFFPANWRRKFAAARKKAKITEWPADVLRHTAISHYFRKTGSYGQAAEQFGNSEAIIKAHYQGRVSSEDTKKFYGLRPDKEGGK